MLCKLLRTVSELGTGGMQQDAECVKNSDVIHTSVLECETPSWNLF